MLFLNRVTYYTPQKSIRWNNTWENTSVIRQYLPPVTRTLLLICTYLFFTQEITSSRITYSCTYTQIFTNCSHNCFCLLVHLYCTILYCHPLCLSCKVQLSCMFVSFTYPSHLCIYFLSNIVSLLIHFTCFPLNHPITLFNTTCIIIKTPHM